MNKKNKDIAKKWCLSRKALVLLMINTAGPLTDEIEPVGELANKPENWTAEHWRWFIFLKENQSE